jgi:hypothetical protein
MQGKQAEKSVISGLEQLISNTGGIEKFKKYTNEEINIILERIEQLQKQINIGHGRVKLLRQLLATLDFYEAIKDNNNFVDNLSLGNEEE